MHLVTGAIHGLGGRARRGAALAPPHDDAGCVERRIEQAIAQRDGQGVADGRRNIVFEHDEHHRFAFEARVFDELRRHVGYEFPVEPAVEAPLRRLGLQRDYRQAQ